VRLSIPEGRSGCNLNPVDVSDRPRESHLTARIVTNREMQTYHAFQFGRTGIRAGARVVEPSGG
jgi:hypothetical protein